jgi:hypothetical protein
VGIGVHAASLVKEPPGTELLAFLDSTADVPELAGFSTGKDDA